MVGSPRNGAHLQSPLSVHYGASRIHLPGSLADRLSGPAGHGGIHSHTEACLSAIEKSVPVSCERARISEPDEDSSPALGPGPRGPAYGRRRLVLRRKPTRGTAVGRHRASGRLGRCARARSQAMELSTPMDPRRTLRPHRPLGSRHLGRRPVPELECLRFGSAGSSTLTQGR